MSSQRAEDRAAVRFDRACAAVDTGCLARLRGAGAFACGSLGSVYIQRNVFTSCLLREQAKMIRTLLSNEVWARIESVLQGKEGDPGRTATDNRWFIEGVLWIGRTGCPWRDLPKEFGRWHTVYMRFSRWRRKGVWGRVAHAVSDEAEIKRVLIDSTIVRAHQHSAGARKKAARKGSGVRAVD